MSNQKPIRVGLVGVGNWATYGHIPALQLLPEYEIAAVCSRSIDKATDTLRALTVFPVSGSTACAMSACIPRSSATLPSGACRVIAQPSRFRNR